MSFQIVSASALSPKLSDTTATEAAARTASAAAAAAAPTTPTKSRRKAALTTNTVMHTDTQITINGKKVEGKNFPHILPSTNSNFVLNSREHLETGTDALVR